MSEPERERMQPLETDRLVLEPLLEVHAAEMWPILSDPALYRYLLAPPPASLEALTERYRKLESRLSPDGEQQWFNWIVRLADGPAMGFVQATLTGEEAWIGYVFGKAFWGRGYALEANRAMVNFLIQREGITLLLASADKGNEPSAKLLGRLGFRQAEESEAKEHEFPDCDHLFLYRP